MRNRCGIIIHYSLLSPLLFDVLIHFQDVNAVKIFSDEAANIYERAITGVLSKNMLLYFAYADFEEGRHKYEKVHQIYSKFLDIPEIDPTLVSVMFSDGKKVNGNRIFFFLLN